ncbi:hypothetical protein [Streptomyces sp. NPDC086519]|uniref:hypothetical protein n=1 Tax=Streptomyces sp. NPDC086519 TaxID=3154863 RepID=UPI003415FD5D
MRIIVVPPPGDPTITVTVCPGEQLLDLNRLFARRVAEPSVLYANAAVLDAPGRSETAGICLLARAAADALAAASDPATRLRALSAAIRVISARDPGLTASIDDIELRTGSTSSSADAARAATRCTLFDPELSAVPTGAKVELVVDSDQQLPTALRLLRRLGPGAATLSGRFVARHRDALRRLPELTGVGLEQRIRPRIVLRQWSSREAALCWCGEGDRPPSAGRWAGWLDAGTVTALQVSELDRCEGLVVTTGGSAELAGPLTALAARFPAAVEILVGVPGGDTSSGAWWSRPGSPVRVAGFRPFRPPLPPGAPMPGGHDLARWAAPAGEATTAEVRRLLGIGVVRHDMFPGRVAGALFAAGPLPVIDGEHQWDPAVRLVRSEHTAPPGSAPGQFLVNLRSGALTRIQPALAGLLEQVRRGGPAATEAVGALPAVRRTRLLNVLRAAGAVRTAEMGVYAP